MRKIGERIGAVLSANMLVVNLLGYGAYVGDEMPPTGFLHDAGCPSPKLQLDDGRIVWGYQCWWSPEEQIKKFIGSREVVPAVIEEE